MSTAKIEIGYDGDAVRGGSMDVRELAPALLALGELLQESHVMLNDGRGQFTTNVKSDFKKGSFEVHLQLVQSLSDQAAFILEHYKHWSAADISKFIGLSAGSGISLIKFLKWLGKRKIKSTTVIQNGNTKIETDGDFDSIEVAPEVIRLAKNRRIRLQLKAVFKPLLSFGIDLFYAKDDGVEVERVKKEDVASFEVPEQADQELTDETRKVAVKLIGVFFEEGLKWKLADGENRFSASVVDENFQKEVDAGKKFSKNDILVVELRTRQVATAEGIKNEHEILKVLKHIRAEEQAQLPFEETSPESPKKPLIRRMRLDE
jgi:hypothetical protein